MYRLLFESIYSVSDISDPINFGGISQKDFFEVKAYKKLFETFDVLRKENLENNICYLVGFSFC